MRALELMTDFSDDGGGSVTLSVTFTVPPMSAESGEEVMRDMGRVGLHTAGHVLLLGSTHYVYWTLDGVGWDPGPFDTSLTGRTGIAVAMTGGNRTAVQVATATASAIDAVSGFSATASVADVQVTGAGSASFGTRTWDDSESGGDHGTAGCQWSTLPGLNSFPIGATSASLLNASALPSEAIVITGWRVSIGNVHTAQLTMALYQGGSADDNPTGASLLGVIGTTTGSETVANQYGATPAPFSADPTAGRLWIVWSHDAGSFEAAYPFDGGNPTHVAAINTSDYVLAGGAAGAGSGVYEMSGITRSSNPANWPATLTAVTNTTTAIPSIMISYVTAAGHQNDAVVVGRIGTRADAANYTGTSGNTLMVGNSHAGPATLGMTVLDAAVAYAAHDSGSDYRLSLAIGGTADDDFSGATFTDIGRAGGTATGWVTVTPTAGSIAIPASSRIWIMIHHEAAGATLLAFDPVFGADIHDPANDPAAYYNGNTSESEADDGSLGGTASTNIDFDEATAQSGAITPNGTIYTNDNNVGVRMRYTVLGAAVA